MNTNTKCAKCGGLMEQKDDDMVCAGCGNTIKIHDTASTMDGADGPATENR